MDSRVLRTSAWNVTITLCIYLWLTISAWLTLVHWIFYLTLSIEITWWIQENKFSLVLEKKSDPLLSDHVLSWTSCGISIIRDDTFQFLSWFHFCFPKFENVWNLMRRSKAICDRGRVPPPPSPETLQAVNSITKFHFFSPQGSAWPLTHAG